MARPKTQTVDWFSHQCVHGKTMFIIEQRFGNDGYAFWFKLLESLGSAEGHFLTLDNPVDWEFFQAKTRLSEESCRQILDLLATLEAIDAPLWREKNIVWSDNFIEGIAAVYKNRRVEMPVKPVNYSRNTDTDTVSTCRNPQRRVEESRVENNTPLPPKGDVIENGSAKKVLEPYSEDFETWWSFYPRGIEKRAAYGCYKQRVKEGVEPETLLQACQNYANSVKGKEPEFIKMPATFLSRKRPFEDWLDKGSAQMAFTQASCGTEPQKPRQREQWENDYCMTHAVPGHAHFPDQPSFAGCPACALEREGKIPKMLEQWANHPGYIAVRKRNA